MARPRDPSVEPRIMAAARERLAAGGYGALTMEAVASRAGVGKPTVYRRWSTRAQLVFELFTNSGVPDPVPDTGSFRGDLTAAGWWLCESLLGADRKIIGDQLGEMIANETFAARVSERRLLPDRQIVAQLWDRAVERGEVRADVDGGAVLDDFVGALVYRVLIRHQPTGVDEVAAIVDRIADGVLAVGSPDRQPARAGNAS